ncbi:hypothetical protein [Ornithinibacillus halophilus]|uniref:Uncharacterized protein n=1 Tax=Ornithinibacillus halophilus TaxID=930117 RepID=A0A1M5M3Y6_9BACI|nr:hypothetical protein [Ornithinibacillus halophilus]SHG71609.1 hypothetical protein SAMN05216225_105319 [Ornithinibacillus halophilus]
MNKKIKLSLILILLLLLFSWNIWVFYQNSKPKTSADLLQELLNNNKYESLILNEGNRKEEIPNKIRNIKSNHAVEAPQKVYQFAIYEYDNQVLLVETTPDLVNHQLYIKNVMYISKSEFEKIFNE